MHKKIAVCMIIFSLSGIPSVCMAGKAVNTWEGNDMFTKKKVDDVEVKGPLDPMWWVRMSKKFVWNMVHNPIYWAITFVIFCVPVSWKLFTKFFGVINKDKFRM